MGRARAGAGAHDPDADPAATDATFDTAIAESAVADDALLATAAAAAATDTAELITIATTWPAPSRTSAPHAPGRDASLALVAELRAHAAECRVPHHLAVKVDTGRDTGRITGAVLFFIAFKASRY